MGGVVVDAASRGLLDDGFEIQVFVFGALDQVVQVSDIGLMVLAIVVFEGFPGHVRLQGVHGVGQGRQGVFHYFSPVVRVCNKSLT